MELWGVGMVDEEVYNVLWQAFQNEKKTNELQHLPKNFYTDVIGFINNYNPNQIIGNTPNIKENAIRLVTGLYDKRKQKIMLYVAYGKQISQNQIKEEMEFYNNLVSLNKSSKINFTKNNDHSLKVLNDIPEIILLVPTLNPDSGFLEYNFTVCAVCLSHLGQYVFTSFTIFIKSPL